MKSHLPERYQNTIDRKIRNAYNMVGYEEAKRELLKVVEELKEINPSASRSLEEGLEETLTVHRLGIGEVLRKTLSNTNFIESSIWMLEKVSGRVKYWRNGGHILRWVASGLLEAEKRFRRVRGWRELKILDEKLNVENVDFNKLSA